MGMYTELVIKANIVSDIPSDVDGILNYLFNDGVMPTELPEHRFFQTPRWDFIGRASSYYHVPQAISYYNKGYLFSRSDLKNYSSEIDLFIDWIKPYIDYSGGDCIGWKWYEESQTPTLIILGDVGSGIGGYIL